MKKLIAIFLMISLFGFLACEDIGPEIFNELVRDNPNDPGYDKEKDPNNKPDLPPVAPGQLSGMHINMEQEIILNWKDNSDYEDGYVVYRSLVTEDKFVKLSVTLPADTEVWTDAEATGLVPKTGYKYYVCGVNGNGEGIASNTIEIRLKQPSVNIMPGQTYTNSEATFLVSFSTDVDGFDNVDTDVVATNGTVTEITKDPNDSYYVVHVTPIDEGDVNVYIPANAAQSPSSGGNLQSIVQKVVCDRTPPVVTLFRLLDTSGYCNTNTLKGRVEFSDNYGIRSYMINDIDGDNVDSDDDWRLMTTQTTGHEFDFPIDISSDGTRAAGIKFMDHAGNAMTTYEYDWTIVDTTPPTVSQFSLFDTDGGAQAGYTNGYNGVDTCSANIVFGDSDGAPVAKFLIKSQVPYDSGDEGNWVDVDDIIDRKYHEIAIPNPGTDSGNQGNKTLYIWVEDILGNRTPYNSPLSPASITYDTIAPFLTGNTGSEGTGPPRVQLIGSGVNNDVFDTTSYFLLDFKENIVEDFSNAKIVFTQHPEDVYPEGGVVFDVSNSSISYGTDNSQIIIDPGTYTIDEVQYDFLEVGIYKDISITGLKDNAGNICNYNLWLYEIEIIE